MSNTTPFYDPSLSYQENYQSGPFSKFKELPLKKLKSQPAELFGISLDIPFGIPAGPLLNNRFMTAAWNWGYSLATYKTVRSTSFPSHPFPNVIKISGTGQEIHPGETVLGDLNIKNVDMNHDGITNSFGVPSQTPSEWQADVKLSLKNIKKGNALILSFMGTKTPDMSRDDYVSDFVKTCLMAKKTGAPILEVNFSCPNFGQEGLICQDVTMSRDILEALNKAKGNTPLLVKIGYFGSGERDNLVKLTQAIKRYADGVVAINTIPAKVVDKSGQQLLPGSSARLSSGVCGARIKWAGLEMASFLVDYKHRNNWSDFVIIGVGGVISVKDYQDYLKLGVTAVQSATGAMWKPDLAIQIRQGMK